MKLDPKAVQLRFIGYGKGSKGYRMMDLHTQKVTLRKDVVFNELAFRSEPIQSQTSGSQKVTVGCEKVADVEIAIESNQVCDPEPTNEEEEPMKEVKDVVVRKRPVRSKKRMHRLGIEQTYQAEVMHSANCATVDVESQTMRQAMMSPNSAQWKRAADDEYNSLMYHDTWELTTPPPDRAIVGLRWVFKVKYDESGEIERFKCRVVAQGFSQTQGVNYEETFAPVAQFNTIRALLAMAVKRGMIVQQMDVVTAFLNGSLKEEIDMKQPEGFVKEGDDELVCKLKKSLYGLKQSPRCWYEKLNSVSHQ